MINAVVAFTAEIDDVRVAVKEILQQLDLAHNLKKHTVGILTCYYDFVHSGVVAAVCEALPFDVVGSTTPAQAVNQEMGILSLTLLMLTSDDVQFAVACSTSLQNEPDAPIRAAYRRAMWSLNGEPRLMLTFAPLILQYAGDRYVEILNDVSRGIPNFGTLSMDDTEDFSECYTIFNGNSARDTLAMVLICGDIHPRFYEIATAGSRVLSHSAVITKSQGNIVKELNGIPFVQFLEGLGLYRNRRLEPGLNYLVCIVEDGRGLPPLGKVLIELDDQGNGVCGGYMPEGATMHISTLTKGDVIKTTGLVMHAATQGVCSNVLLAFSCGTRNIALGTDVYAEFDTIDRIVANRIPYLATSSGGEICPYVMEDGTVVNRYHNNAFVVCTF